MKKLLFVIGALLVLSGIITLFEGNISDSIITIFVGAVLMFFFRKKTSKQLEGLAPSSKSMTAAIPDFVAFDFETTGLSSKYDRPTEFAGVIFQNGMITDRLTLFINPERPIPEKIVQNFCQTVLPFHRPDTDASVCRHLKPNISSPQPRVPQGAR